MPHPLGPPPFDAREWACPQCGNDILFCPHKSKHPKLSEQSQQLLVRPYLEWEGPDADGDLIVRLQHCSGEKGTWSLTAHGKTEQEALARLGAFMKLAGEPE